MGCERAVQEFLADREPKTWVRPAGLPAGFKPAGYFAQESASGLEVVLATTAGRPSAADMRKAHAARRDGRASPVLMTVLHPASRGVGVTPGGGTRRRAGTHPALGGAGATSAGGSRGGAGLQPATDCVATLCGPTGEAPPVWRDLDPVHAERIVRLALDEPSHHAAVRFLATVLPELFSPQREIYPPVPGLRNVGLLATHELNYGVDQRPDWDDAVRRAVRF